MPLHAGRIQRGEVVSCTTWHLVTLKDEEHALTLRGEAERSWVYAEATCGVASCLRCVHHALVRHSVLEVD